jgi:hypothetical protein
MLRSSTIALLLAVANVTASALLRHYRLPSGPHRCRRPGQCLYHTSLRVRIAALMFIGSCISMLTI